MSDVDPKTEETAERRLLRIVSGLHAGACRELAEREMILVGSGDDCDIVLADNGVAHHHALICVVDGRFQLRALDAPLQLEGRTLHPGDPVEMDRLQRVGLGEAALAFGLEDDPAWLALAPDEEQPAAVRARRFTEPITRRLPLVAAVAVLSLASLAIFVAVVPSAESKIEPEARLQELAREFQVSGRKIEKDVNGKPVLAGMVADAAARRDLQERVAKEELDVTLVLTTGEDLAINVSEVLRAGGFPAERTRYLGRGRVEATGYFEDPEAFTAFVQTGAVVATGVREIVPINLADVEEEAPAAAAGPVRIVSYERGEDPYLLDEHGNEYRVGMEIPGEGVLNSLGKHAMVTTPEGDIKRIAIRPIREEEKAEAEEDVPASDDQTQSRSRAWATEQARAARHRQ
ncbi:FHA domain-containing protein [Luteimonas sp. JM171]|uniref:FHA domain-containing protein n=1 Tax=Luteimonas sp. JM171 TaxID=1896164 RepID=UPI000858A866|nr:FHA domain-containing protein [Luteimonas sp. JM171]AOH35920.1 hypothetical protein BGP89_05720 [Luteimonas sp. JM171]